LPDRLMWEMWETPNPSAPQGGALAACLWAGMLPVFKPDELGEPASAASEGQGRTSRTSRSRSSQTENARTAFAALSPRQLGLVVAIAEFIGPGLLGLFADEQTPLRFRLQVLEFVHVLQAVCPEILMPGQQ